MARSSAVLDSVQTLSFQYKSKFIADISSASNEKEALKIFAQTIPSIRKKHNHFSDVISTFSYQLLLDPDFLELRYQNIEFEIIDLLLNNLNWDYLQIILARLDDSISRRYLELAMHFVVRPGVVTSPSSLLESCDFNSFKFTRFKERHSKMLICRLLLSSSDKLLSIFLHSHFTSISSRQQFACELISSCLDFLSRYDTNDSIVSILNSVIDDLKTYSYFSYYPLSHLLLKSIALRKIHNCPEIFESLKRSRLPSSCWDDFSYCSSLISKYKFSYLEKHNELNNIPYAHKRSLFIMMPIWGDYQTYIKTLLDMCWFTFSTSVDFNRISDEYDIKFLIYTTPESHDLVKQKLSTLSADFEIIIDTSILRNNASALTNKGRIYIHAMEYCMLRNAVMIAFSPDVLYGNGLFTMIQNCPEGGISAVPILRSGFENVSSFLAKSRDSLVHNIDRNKILSRMFLNQDFYHPFQRLYFDNLTDTQLTTVTQQGSLFYTSALCATVFKPTAELLHHILHHSCPRYSVSGAENLANWLDHQGPHLLSQAGLLHSPSSSTEFILIEPQSDRGYQSFHKLITLPGLYRYSLDKHSYLVSKN